MEWHVFLYDYNTQTLRPYNIFDNNTFKQDIEKILKTNYEHDRENYELAVRRALQYSFWAKCEYEYIVTAWPPIKDERGIKIDVYQQVLVNFKAFMDYLDNLRRD